MCEIQRKPQYHYQLFRKLKRNEIYQALNAGSCFLVFDSEMDFSNLK